MTNRLWATAIERAGVLTAPLALDELPDSDLVRRFLAAREEQAFAAIVRRHGPLVWGVCRNLLPSEADAEDAYQATFLALVKSAPRIQRPNALGAWLHRVAGRVCRHSLRAISRRRRHEQSAAIEEAARPVDEATWDRWHAAVHEEIDRLPDTLRVPFVLCVLQGLRQPDAARRLGWKLGTVSGRVCKAKQALADAVTRRGLAGAAVLAAVIGGSAPLPAGLAALGRAVNLSGSRPGDGVSLTVHELARGAMGGLMSKSKLLAAAIVAGTMAIGLGTSVLSTAGAQTSGSSDTAPNEVGRGQQPGGLGLPGPGGPGGLAPGGGGPGGAMPGMAPGGGGGGGMMSSAARGPRIEYQFVPRPKASDAFKKLLNQHGTDGWEYVGPVPGDDELIFKRLRPAGGIMSGGGMGMPGMGAGSGFGGIGGGFSGMPGMGGALGTGGFGGMNQFGGPKGASGSSSGAAPKTGGATRPAGGGDTMPGEAGAGGPMPPKGQATITLRVGETIRYKMASQKEIDRVYSHESRVAEANPDPTDAKRVLLKGVAPGGSRLELTDTNGVKEEYMIRVR